MLVGPSGVGVRHHDVGRQVLAAGQRDAGGAWLSPRCRHAGDLPHLGVQPQARTAAFQQADQALNQSTGAAHRPVHAELALQRSDQAVNAGAGERVAADQQRVEAEHDAQLRVTQMPGGHGVQRLPGAHLHHRRHGRQQVADGVEGHGGEFLEAQLVAAVGLGDERLVAGQIRRAEAGDLGAHRGVVAAVVEVRAVVELDAIKRIQRAQLDIVGHLAAAQRPQLFEHERHGDDGRPGVERVAVLSMNIGAAAGSIELFQHRDLIAPNTQSDGGSQAAEAAADHQGGGRCVGTACRFSIGRGGITMFNESAGLHRSCDPRDTAWRVSSRSSTAAISVSLD